MISFTPEQTEKLLQHTAFRQKCSDCGYFSSPFRVAYEENELIVKTFLPVSNKALVDEIIQNHEAYVAAMKAIGIRVPETFITCMQRGTKHQIVIVQQPFSDEELVRDMVAKLPLPIIINLCRLIYVDIIRFCYRKNLSQDIGFHPSLRNYALREGQLWYFDTFPPILMDQQKLNRIIIVMSPYGRLIKKITPPRMLNRVSNEYYYMPKMFAGVVGSCCRLRPELSEDILGWSKEYVQQSPDISAADKAMILSLLKQPPHLSKLWIAWRNLSGNTGKPNV
jgi:hypothetical protein